MVIKQDNITHWMNETRFHGRDGQGVVSAAALLASAAFDDGFESQAFPKFASEQCGAPAEAYVRISDTAIRSYYHVYSPDVLVIQDSTLLDNESVLLGLKANGSIIINSANNPKIANKKGQYFHCYSVNADLISKQFLGQPSPNTVLLGALAAATQWVKLSTLVQATMDHFANEGHTIVEANIAALKEGYRLITQNEEVAV